MIRPDRNILTAALLLEATATNVEKARRHLTAELHLQDGTPTTASGSDNDGSRGERTVRVLITNYNTGEPILDANGQPQYDNVPVTIVEAAAINRQHITNMRNDLDACVHGVVTMANNIANTCTRILSERIQIPRCSATGRDGSIEWADPTCTAVPSRGPLCDRCSQREYRWRAAHNMPARTDGLFTADPAT